MSCTNLITSGLGYECSNNSAGIQNIYITDLANISGTTLTSNEVTAISMVSGKKFYDFYIRSTSNSSFSEKYTINKENGSSYVEQTLVLDFLLRDSVKRLAIASLAYGQKRLAVLVKDYNGNVWFMGYVDGAMLTNSDSVSGSKKGDRNGYTITLMAEEIEQAYPVNPAIVDALL